MVMSVDAVMRSTPGLAVAVMATDSMPLEDRDGNDIYSLRQDPLRDWADLTHDAVTSRLLAEGWEDVDGNGGSEDDEDSNEPEVPVGESDEPAVPMVLDTDHELAGLYQEQCADDTFVCQCSAKGKEIGCKTAKTKCDRARQPYFKGKERKPRHLKKVEVTA